MVDYADIGKRIRACRLAKGMTHVNQDDLLKYKEPELSKTALKTALKAGLIVPGATVKTSFNLQIK